jgi:hypothetical protein
MLDSKTSPVEVLKNVPDKVPFPQLASSFLCRSLAASIDTANGLRLKSALAQQTEKHCRQRLANKSSLVSLVIREDTKCVHCGKCFGLEDFVRYPDTRLSHLNCHKTHI